MSFRVSTKHNFVHFRILSNSLSCFQTNPAFNQDFTHVDDDRATGNAFTAKCSSAMQHACVSCMHGLSHQLVKHVDSIAVCSFRRTNSFGNRYTDLNAKPLRCMQFTHRSKLNVGEMWNLRFPQVTWDDPLPSLGNLEAFSLEKILCNLFDESIIPRIPIDA